MKLYNADLSPFAGRVRMQVYAKGLDVEIVRPPEGGLKSPEYLAVNPLGRVPCLVDGDLVLPESGAITAYLEDAHPSKSLKGGPDAKARARVRLVEDVAMLGVMAAMSKLFPQLNPKTRNQEAVDAALVEMDRALAAANKFVVGPYAGGEALTLADCALAPALFFVTSLLPAFGRTDPLGVHNPRLQAYWAHVREDGTAAKVLAEMGAALAAMNRR